MSYKSVWDFGRSEKVRGIHAIGDYPTKILPNAAHEIVLRFSKEGDTLLDPFCGSGTFAIEAKALNRNSINYDINDKAVALIKERLKLLGAQMTLNEQLMQCAACEKELKHPIVLVKTEHTAEEGDARKLPLKDESVDCIITDIPYASMIKYSKHKDDLSNIEDYGQFLIEIKKSFDEMFRVLKHDKYCVVFVADYRIGASRKIYPVHADVITQMREKGFTLFDLYIWRYYRSGGFRPFGAKPFQAMNVHSYILVFFKNGGPELNKKNREIHYRERLTEKIEKNGHSKKPKRIHRRQTHL